LPVVSGRLESRAERGTAPQRQIMRTNAEFYINHLVPVGCGDHAFRVGTASIEVFGNDAVHFAHHILLFYWTPFCNGVTEEKGCSLSPMFAKYREK
jgi:hypothetical protein